MNTLRLFTLKDFSVPASTSWYLADLGEFRGKQTLYTQQSPQRLKTLREHALIESAVSSNRIEGFKKKGWYKEFVDEIIPPSRFAAQKYPETYRIQPVLGSQGYDALVYDETGTEVDRVEMTRPPAHRGENLSFGHNKIIL